MTEPWESKDAFCLALIVAAMIWLILTSGRRKKK